MLFAILSYAQKQKRLFKLFFQTGCNLKIVIQFFSVFAAATIAVSS